MAPPHKGAVNFKWISIPVVLEWSWNLCHSLSSSLSFLYPYEHWPLDIVWLGRTGNEEGRNGSIILFPSLKPVKCSRRTELLSINCKINAYCINKFTKMPPVELLPIFDSHSSFLPFGLTSFCVFMAFYSFLKCLLARKYLS